MTKLLARSHLHPLVPYAASSELRHEEGGVPSRVGLAAQARQLLGSLALRRLEVKLRLSPAERQTLYLGANNGMTCSASRCLDLE